MAEASGRSPRRAGHRLRPQVGDSKNIINSLKNKTARNISIIRWIKQLF